MSSIAHLFETKIIMKNFTLLLWLLTIISTANGLKAQYATVNFDLEKNYFNEGQPLPAGKNLMFTGIIPEGVSRIEIDIYAGKKRMAISTKRTALIIERYTE
jgi:hypothetical protein